MPFGSCLPSAFTNSSGILQVKPALLKAKLDKVQHGLRTAVCNFSSKWEVMVDMLKGVETRCYEYV